MGIQYDNSAFYYFMGTMLQFYLLPATWYNIKQFYLFLEARANVGKDLGKGRTAAERKKFERIREERKKCNNLFTSCFTVQFIILLLLWALFVFIMALAGADSEIMQFDPYKILGVETDAEMKQIKRAYRKQSLIWHPDKNPGNAAAEDKFMTIAKAYEALTDPEARENWKNYGNPDGKQSMEVSIGLPSYLMDSENHSTVMIIYLLVLVIVIPVCVWKYYSWSRAYMDAVLTETYTVFGDIKLFNQNTSMKHIPEVICMAAEFKDLDEVLKVKKAADALGNVEKKLKIKGMLPKPMFRSFEGKKIEGFFNHFRGNKLAFILMYAHLNREPIDDCLVKASEKVLKKVPLLIESLAHIGEERTKASGANPRTIAISGQWLMAVHNVLLFSQCMTQAIWYPPQNSSGRNNVGGRSLQSSLLQLPHFTSTEIGENKRGKHNQSKKREDEMKLYLRGDHLERDGESFKRGQKNFTEEQKLDVKAVEALLPDLDLSVQYGVDGEDQVVAEDLITVDFRLKRHGCETVKSMFFLILFVIFMFEKYIDIQD
jgi:translocation protein SEC63